MWFARCQKGDVRSASDLRLYRGSVGVGVYAIPVPSAGSDAMVRFYSRDGESVSFFNVPDRFVMKVRGRRNAVEAEYLIESNPDIKVFIFRHQGIGIPVGWQAVVVDVSVVQIEGSSGESVP